MEYNFLFYLYTCSFWASLVSMDVCRQEGVLRVEGRGDKKAARKQQLLQQRVLVIIKPRQPATV